MNYEIVTQIMVEKARKVLPSDLAETDPRWKRAIWAAIQADPETAQKIAAHVEHRLCPMCGYLPRSCTQSGEWLVECPQCALKTRGYIDEKTAWMAWDRRSEVR